MDEKTVNSIKSTISCKEEAFGILGRPEKDRDSRIIRYYCSGIKLRFRSPYHDCWKDTNDNGYSFLGYEEKKDIFGASSICAILPLKKEKHYKEFHADCTFIIIPAEGFEKEHGQPVYSGDPVQLVDSKGRILGRVNRFPYGNNCIGPGGNDGPMILDFRLDTKRSKKSGDERVIRPSVVELCSGDRVVIQGIKLMRKNKFIGGYLMFSEESDSELVCQIFLDKNFIDKSVLLQPIQYHPSIETDRTSTGLFVGSLHVGFMYKKSKFTKTWKHHYFILTHLALHWFDPSDVEEDDNHNLQVKRGKSKGQLQTKDIACVLYDQFASPHHFEIVNNFNESAYLHCSRAVDCSRWVHVLQTASEKPEWIHTDTSCITVYRSDKYFESKKCPCITKIIKKDKRKDPSSSYNEDILIKAFPQWEEIIMIDCFNYHNEVEIHLDSGKFLTLSLEDLNRCSIRPCWIEIPDNTHSQGQYIEGLITRFKCFSKVQVENLELTTSSSASASSSLTKKWDDITQHISKQFIFIMKYVVPYVLFTLIFFFYSALYAFICLLAYFIGWYYLVIKSRNCSACSSVTKVTWILIPIALEVRPQIENEDNSGNKKDSDVVSPYLNSKEHSEDKTMPDALKEIKEINENQNLPKQNLASLETDCLHDNFVAERWKSTYQFRMENGLEHILEFPQKYFFLITRYFPHTLLGKDRFGHFILNIQLRHINWDRLIMCQITQSMIVRHFLFLWEYISSISTSSNKSEREIIIIIDANDIGFDSIYGNSVSFVRDLMVITTKHYPGYINQIIAINSSTRFSTGWTLLKSSLDQSMRERCHECPSEYVKTMLLDLISPSVLPVEYGGQQTNFDMVWQNLILFVQKKICQTVRQCIESISKEEIEKGILLAKGVGIDSWQNVLCIENKFEFRMGFIPAIQSTYSTGYYVFSSIDASSIFDYVSQPSKRILWDAKLVEFRILGEFTPEESVVLMSQYALKGDKIVSNVIRRHCNINLNEKAFSVVWKTLSSDYRFHRDDNFSLNDEAENLINEQEQNKRLWVSGSIYVEQKGNEGCILYFSHLIDSSGVALASDVGSWVANTVYKEFQVLEAFASNPNQNN